jgi:hypothetical protein
MSTTIWRKVLIACDLRKRDISNRVLSLIEDIKGRIASQKGPKRGLLSRLWPKKGRFWTVIFGACFGLPGLNYHV